MGIYGDCYLVLGESNETVAFVGIYADTGKVFLSLRDERREQARKRIEKLQAQQDRL